MAALPQEFLKASPTIKAQHILRELIASRSYRLSGAYFDYLNLTENAQLKQQVLTELATSGYTIANPLPEGIPALPRGAGTTPPVRSFGHLIANTGITIPDEVMKRAITQDILRSLPAYTHSSRPGRLFIQSGPANEQGDFSIKPIPDDVQSAIFAEIQTRLRGVKPEDYDGVMRSTLTYARVGDWVSSRTAAEFGQKVAAQKQAIDQAIQTFSSEANILAQFPEYEYLSSAQRLAFVDQLKRSGTSLLHTDPERLGRGDLQNELQSLLSAPSFIQRQRTELRDRLIAGIEDGSRTITNREFLISRMLTIGKPDHPEFKAALATLSSGDQTVLSGTYRQNDWAFRDNKLVYRDPAEKQARAEQFAEREAPKTPGYEYLTETQRTALKHRLLESGVVHLGTVGSTLDATFLAQQQQAYATHLLSQSNATNRDYLVAQMLANAPGSPAYKAAEEVLKTGDKAILDAKHHPLASFATPIAGTAPTAREFMLAQVLQLPADDPKHIAAKAILADANNAAALAQPYKAENWTLNGNTYSFEGAKLPDALTTQLTTFATRPIDGSFPELRGDAVKLGEAIKGLDAAQLPALQALLAQTNLGPVHAEYLRRQLDSLNVSGDAAKAKIAMVAGLTEQITKAAANFDQISRNFFETHRNSTNPEAIVGDILSYYADASNGLPAENAQRQALLTSLLDKLTPEQLLGVARSADQGPQDWIRARASELLFAPGAARRDGAIKALADERLRAAMPQFNYLPTTVQDELRKAAIAEADATLTTPSGIQSFITANNDALLTQARRLLEEKATSGQPLTNRDHLLRRSLDPALNQTERDAAIQGLKDVPAGDLDKPYDATALKTDGKTFTFGAAPVVDNVAPLVSEITRYSQMKLDGAFADVQLKAEEIAKKIAALSPDDLKTLHTRIQDSPLRNSPVHAAYLAYFTGEQPSIKDALKVAPKDSPAQALMISLRGEKDAQGKPITTGMKGNTLTALSTSAATLEGKSTVEIMAAITNWQRGQDHTGAALPKYQDVDVNLRPHMVAAAMDDLNTGQLMAVRAQIKATEAALTGGATLPKEQQEMLTRIDALMNVHTRTEEVAAITKFQTDLTASIPGFNYLTAEQQQRLMDPILHEAGKVAGGADYGKKYDALAPTLEAELGKLRAAVAALPIVTNRDFLIRQMLDNPAGSDAHKAAAAALKPESGLGDDALKQPYDAAKLKLTDGAYRIVAAATAPALGTSAQLIKDIKAFGELSPALGRKALEDQAKILMQSVATLPANEAGLFNRAFSIRNPAISSLSPFHASLLKAAIPVNVPDKQQWIIQRNQLIGKINDLNPESFATIADAADKLKATPNALAPDLIAGATSWLKPDGGILNSGYGTTTLIPDNANRPALLTAALDRMTTAQLTAIQERLQSRVTEKSDSLSVEEAAVLTSAKALLESDARKAQATQFQQHLTELRGTPGFNHLTEEQQRIVIDRAVLAAGNHLATGDKSLDTAFLATQRETMATLLAKGTGTAQTNREFLAAQLMRPISDEYPADHPSRAAAAAALDKATGLSAAILDSTNPDALRLTGNKYEGVQTSTLAEIGQSLREFAALPSAASFAEIQTRAQTISALFRDNPSTIKAFAATQEFAAQINALSPIHAAYLEQSLRALPDWKTPADNTPQSAALAALKARMGPGFAALLADARKVGADHTTSREQLLEIFNHWSQGKDSSGAELPAIDPALKDQMLRAAIDQLNVGQFARITGPNMVISNEVGDSIAIPSAIGNLMGDAYKARVDGSVAIRELTDSVSRAFPDYHMLSVAQQTKFKEDITVLASQHLSSGPDKTLNDPAFTEQLQAVRTQIATPIADIAFGERKTFTAMLFNEVPGYIHLPTDQQNAILEAAKAAAIPYLAGEAGRTVDAAFIASDAMKAVRERVATEAAAAITDASKDRELNLNLPGAEHMGERRAGFITQVRTEAEQWMKEGKPINEAFWARMRSLEVQRVEKAIADKTPLTAREFLVAQMMRPAVDGEAPEVTRARTAAAAALKPDGGLSAEILSRPYSPAQFKLSTEGEPTYSYTAPRMFVGGRVGEIARGLGYIDDAKYQQLLAKYNTDFTDKTLAELGLSPEALKDKEAPLAALTALRQRMAEFTQQNPHAEIKTWLAEQLKAPELAAVLTPLVRTDGTINGYGNAIDGVIARIAHNHQFGSILDGEFRNLEASIPRLKVGGVDLPIREVASNLQAGDRLQMLSRGDIPAGLSEMKYDLAKPEQLRPFLTPDQSLARAAAMVYAARDTDKTLSESALKAAGQLGLISQIEMLRHMEASDNPQHKAAAARLKEEIGATPDGARLLGLDPKALATERTTQRDTFLKEARALIAKLPESPARAGHLSFLEAVATRSELSAAQFQIGRELTGDRNAGLDLRGSHATALHEVLKDLKAEATIADAAKAFAAKLATGSPTRADFLLAQQAEALSRGAAGADEAASIRGEIAKLGNLAREPLPFEIKEDKPAIKPEAVIDAAKARLRAMYGDNPLLDKALENIAPPSAITDLKGLDDAITARLAAMKESALKSLEGDQTTLGFAALALLNAPDEVARNALREKFEAVQMAAGGPAAMAALKQNILNDRLDIDPKLAKAALDGLGTDAPAPLRALLTREAEKVPAIYTRDNLRDSFLRELPEAVRARIGSPDKLTHLNPTMPLVGDKSRDAALKAAYEEAINAIGEPKNAADHLAIATLRAKATLVDKPADKERPEDTAALRTLANASAILANNPPEVINNPHATVLAGSDGKLEFIAAPVLRAGTALPVIAREAAALVESLKEYRAFEASALPTLRAVYAPTAGAAPVEAAMALKSFASHTMLQIKLTDGDRSTDAAAIKGLYDASMVLIDGLKSRNTPISAADQTRIDRMTELYGTIFKKYMTEGGIDLTKMQKDGAFLSSDAAYPMMQIQIKAMLDLKAGKPPTLDQAVDTTIAALEAVARVPNPIGTSADRDRAPDRNLKAEVDRLALAAKAKAREAGIEVPTR